MSKVTLKVNGESDLEFNVPLISIGRVSDNMISLPEDSNISRYHARIEQREDGFWLVELGSSNGTAVNGSEVDGEILLQDGDTIVLGGTSEIQFNVDDGKAKDSETAESPETQSEVTETAAEKTPAKSSSLTLVAGAVVGVAVIFAATAGIYYWSTSGGKCDATARIKSPDNGEMVTAAVEVEIEVTNSQCVQNAIFAIDGQEFASASSEPFKVSLDPNQFPDLADGLNHSLKIVLVDAKGEKFVQADEVLLAFETLATPTPTPEKTETPKTNPKTPPNKQLGGIEMQEMVKRLLKQFSETPNYKFDPQFLVEVNKKTAEYVSEGYFARAQQYRDVINVSYVQVNDLDAPLGYILAMSRSKFNPAKQGTEEGLWRMSNEFVTTNAYDGQCETKTLGDASQSCAAVASAAYLKQIVKGVFNKDVIYGVAAFGMSLQETGEWAATLPANRTDFWKEIKAPKQREEVVRFFAAGIVAENPQKFGLKKDRPISELYRIVVGN